MKQSKLVAGHGINDVPNGRKDFPEAYLSWRGKLSRAYSVKFHIRNPSYIGVTVSDEWLKFSNYLKWWLINHRKGYEADKDILIPGNRQYSPDAVRYVPNYVNSLFTDKAASRGRYSLGVTYDSKNDRYMSACSQLGRKRVQKWYPTEAEAHRAWQSAKIVAIELVIARYKTEPFPLPEIIDALQARIAVLKSDIQNKRITVKL
ncbi:hypothetical protein [Pseudescherichia sp.]|uniref:hypothetical protein n=1 Tax=Pseudescherichia sp. TaxID=2055881 RepID=UPI002897B685|nr:hypothetical protein [Pseudescherichia sp.]